jgi:hypothetical protein
MHGTGQHGLQTDRAVSFLESAQFHQHSFGQRVFELLQAHGRIGEVGPYYPQSTYSYPLPLGDGVPSAPAAPPQSPSGSVTGQSAT